MINLMKIKKKYIFILAIIIGFSIFYTLYGWVWNPWADKRIVWDEPSPELAGNIFSITGRATYRTEIDYLPISVKKAGVKAYILTNPENRTGCSEANTKNIALGNGSFSSSCDKWETITPNLILPTENFTIEKTYWIRKNMWSLSFSGSDYKYAIISDQKNNKYTIDFSDFEHTNRPDLNTFPELEVHRSPWDLYKNTFSISDQEYLK
jgi:hypothetical protein